MAAFRDTWVGKGVLASGKALTRVPSDVYRGITIATAGAVAGYAILLRQTGLGETLAENIVDPIRALHAVGGATAAYVGLKRNLVDLLVPAGIVLVDNVFRKVTDSGYTFEQLAADARPELIGMGALYAIGLGVKKILR